MPAGLDASYVAAFKIIYQEEGAEKLQETYKSYMAALQKHAQLSKLYTTQRERAMEQYVKKEASLTATYQASMTSAQKAAADRRVQIEKAELDARQRYRLAHNNTLRGFNRTNDARMIAEQREQNEKWLTDFVTSREKAYVRAKQSASRVLATEKARLAGSQKIADEELKTIEKTVSATVARGKRVGALMAGMPVGQFTLFLDRFQQVFRRVFDALGSFLILNAVSQVIGGFIRSVYNANVALENLGARLRTVIRGPDSISAIRDEILRLTVQTPFVIKDFTDATVTLEAFGLRSIKYLKPIADWAAAIGRDLNDVALAFAKVSIYSPRTALLLTTRGISKRDFDIELLKVKNAAEALNNVIRRNFGDTAIYMSRTFSGVMSNISDAWTQLADVFGEATFQHLKRFVILIYQLLVSEDVKEGARTLGGLLKFIVQTLEGLVILLSITLLRSGKKWVETMLKGATAWMAVNKNIGAVATFLSKPAAFFGLIWVGTAIADMIANMTAFSKSVEVAGDAIRRSDINKYLAMTNEQMALLQERMTAWEWQIVGRLEALPKAIWSYYKNLYTLDFGAMVDDWVKAIDSSNTVLGKQIQNLQKVTDLALELKRITTTPLPATGAAAALELREQMEGDIYGAQKLRSLLKILKDISAEAANYYSVTGKPVKPGTSEWMKKYLTADFTALLPVNEQQIVKSIEQALARQDAATAEALMKKLMPVALKSAREAVKVIEMALANTKEELHKMSYEEFVKMVESPEGKERLRKALGPGALGLDALWKEVFDTSARGMDKSKKHVEDYSDRLAAANMRLRELLSGESQDYARAEAHLAKYLQRYKIYAASLAKSGKDSEETRQAEVEMMEALVEFWNTRATIEERTLSLEDRAAETYRGMVESQINLNKARAEYNFLLTRDPAATRQQYAGDKERLEAQLATLDSQIATKRAELGIYLKLKSGEKFLQTEAALNDLYKERFDTMAAIYGILIQIFNLPSRDWAEAFNKVILQWKENLTKFYDDMASTVMEGLKDVVVESINDLIFGVEEATSRVDEYRRELEGVYVERAREMAMLNKYRRREDETTEAYAERLFLVEEENKMAMVQYEYKTKELEILEKINQEEAKRNSLVLQRFKNLGGKIFDKLLDYGIQALASWAFGGGTTGGATGEATAYRTGVELPPQSPSGRTVNINVTGNTVYGSDDFEKMVDDAVGKYARYRTA